MHNPTRELTGFVAFEGNTLIGGSNLAFPLLDNQHLAYAEPLVRPGFRRRGVGTKLLNAVIETMRARRRTTLIIEAHKPLDSESSPGWSFLRHHGFTPGILALHRVLDLPASAEHLEELGKAVEPHHRDYRLVTWQDRAPDEWVPGVCEIQSAFNEAPSGELELEAEVWDEERLRGGEERRRALGRSETSTIAVSSEGRVVALTEMMITDHRKGAVFQGGTLVLPEARGHRLGMAIKVANLRRFQGTTQKATLVHSWNAEENGPMVRINDALGFRPVEHLAEMQLKL